MVSTCLRIWLFGVSSFCVRLTEGVKVEKSLLRQIQTRHGWHLKNHLLWKRCFAVCCDCRCPVSCDWASCTGWKGWVCLALRSVHFVPNGYHRLAMHCFLLPVLTWRYCFHRHGGAGMLLASWAHFQTGCCAWRSCSLTRSCCGMACCSSNGWLT